MGCANPEGATGFNIARQIALRAGCPVTTSGMTVNRYCSSGLQTIALAAQRIIAGEGEVYVAGGVESISCVQNERMNTVHGEGGLARGEQAGDLLDHAADRGEPWRSRYQIPREAQDRYGVQSQQRAAAAQAAGRFADEIVPIDVVMGAADRDSGRLMTRKVTVSADEGIRAGH